jgi:hypothetical protein
MEPVFGDFMLEFLAGVSEHLPLFDGMSPVPEPETTLIHLPFHADEFRMYGFRSLNNDKERMPLSDIEHHGLGFCYL